MTNCVRVNNAVLRFQGNIHMIRRDQVPTRSSDVCTDTNGFREQCLLLSQGSVQIGLYTDVAGLFSLYGVGKHICNLCRKQMCFNLCLPRRWEESAPPRPQLSMILL